MKSSLKKEGWYLSWFKKAEEDELSIGAILKEGSPSTACFLCQQMAEKYLKGLLIFYGKEFPKIHDLERLEDLLLEDEPDIAHLHSDLSLLNRYSVETRYPDDREEFSLVEAEEAYVAARKIKDFVLDAVYSKK